MRSAILIANAAAGRRGKGPDVSEVLARLRQRGISSSVAETSHPGHATEIARRAVDDSDVELVVALGGDGTVREVAAGIMGTDATLLPLPRGTTNVVATGLGLGSDPLSIIDGLDSLRVRALDVGMCGVLPFLMQASIGLDAFVMAELRQELKMRLGIIAVGLTGAACWLRYGYPEIHVSVDGVRVACRGAIVSNFPFYAGPYRLVPHGRADDGQLEVVLFEGRGRAAAAAFAIDLARGRHAMRKDVQIRTAERVRFESPADASVQSDGDPLRTALPMEVFLSPRRVHVLCSASTSAVGGGAD